MPVYLARLRRSFLALQTLSFLMVAVVIWLDEAVDFPHMFFHAVPTPFRPQEAGLESILLALVALGSLAITNTLFRRLAEADSFLAFCPACQRVRRGDEWTTASDVVQDYLGDAAHYGLCPACLSRVPSGVEGGKALA